MYLVYCKLPTRGRSCGIRAEWCGGVKVGYAMRGLIGLTLAIGTGTGTGTGLERGSHTAWDHGRYFPGLPIAID